MVEHHADRVVLARSAADIRRAVARGQLASLMGLEGGHIIEGRLAALRSFYRLGVRYMTLTHSFNTEWADSSGTTDPVAPRHGGLTDFGEHVVREMNRLGMMVDVSHVSDETFWDALATSRAPLIASHSSARGVTDHPRNLSDEMLGALAARGGVAMLNFYSAYIHAPTRERVRAFFAEHREALDAIWRVPELTLWERHARARAFYAAHPVPRAPLDALLDHFDHAIRVAGADHVGLGADWDGVASMPEGLEDVSRLPVLTHGLLARGHSPATVRKVLGENLLRVMSEVERSAHGTPP
jgi:membrane dipeptidase